MTPTAHLDVESPRGRRSVSVPADQPNRLLADLLRQIDLPLNTRCGQRGQCDGCLVDLLDGQLIESAAGAAIAAGNEPVRVRACQVCLAAGGRAEVRVPARSLLAHQAQVVTTFRVNVPRAYDPLWQKITIGHDELPPDTPWLDALCSVVARKQPGKVPLSVDGSLSAVEPADQSELSLAIQHQRNHWSLRPMPAGSESRVFGAAIDIGTTTVVVLLVDLATGDIAGEAAALNTQTELGDNVLTRINLCMTDKPMVGRLQQSVVRKTLGPLLQQTFSQADASPDQLVCMTVAGNSTMLHLLDGVDPTSMGLAPFTPTFLEHRVISAGHLPWHAVSAAHEPSPSQGTSSEDLATSVDEPSLGDAPIHLLPGAAAYLGADVVAGIFSSGMAYATETCLLVDVGTNGEIVLKHGDQLLACATAAGPAFEGSGLMCGMRAGKGAIGHVWFEKNRASLKIDVIGGAKPIGICGTAYVDVIAQARNIGLIGPTGRFLPDVVDDWPVEPIRHGQALTIAQGRGGEPIYVTEGDIASLLQAKAAIAAGIICLLDRVGMRCHDVTTLFLAGGFGFHMNVQHAIDLGLLPGFRASQVQLIGNSSLAGAYLALLDSGALDEISRIGSAIETVELNLEPQFESTYIDQLSLQ